MEKNHFYGLRSHALKLKMVNTEPHEVYLLGLWLEELDFEHLNAMGLDLNNCFICT